MKADIDQLKKNNHGKTNYLTHNFHTYPAKYIPQIPRYFIEKFTKPGDRVYEPFLGCGTTLVECKLLGRDGIGIDLNPIATLISKSKTQELNQIQIDTLRKFISNIEKQKIKKKDFFLQYEKLNKLEFANKDHWFKKNVQVELSYIRYQIKKNKDHFIQDFLNVALSSIIVEVSNQESDTRYVAKNKTIDDFQTLGTFNKKCLMMIDRILAFSEVSLRSNVEIYTQSSCDVPFIANNSCDFVITSPPYANTYDYYLYHKSRMNWLEFDYKKVQEGEIGSRDKHSSRRLGIDTFLNDLELCFSEISRVLKKGKYAVIVIGDSVIRGEFHDAKEFTEVIFKKHGFKLAEYSSQNLKETTRMFNPKFTNSLKNEHILVFKKL